MAIGSDDDNRDNGTRGGYALLFSRLGGREGTIAKIGVAH